MPILYDLDCVQLTQSLVDYLNRNSDDESPEISLTRHQCLTHIEEGIPAYEPPLPVDPRAWNLQDDALCHSIPEELFY